jgi:hypothetical protein
MYIEKTKENNKMKQYEITRTNRGGRFAISEHLTGFQMLGGDWTAIYGDKKLLFLVLLKKDKRQ